VRLPNRLTDDERGFLLEPERLVRWVYVGRLSLATAIFLAAVLAAPDPDTDGRKIAIATLAFAATLTATGLSVLYSGFYRRPLRNAFFYIQAVFDLLLVTAVVHVTATKGTPSQFAALYILVIATSSLLLPVGGGLLVALLGNVLYVADAAWVTGAPFTVAVWLQLAVFAVVALGSAYLSAKVKELSAGTEAELARVRLEAADILHNIRSGILTIDSGGHLLYANPMAEQLLAIDLEAMRGHPVLDRLQSVAPELAAALEKSVRDRLRTTRGEGMIAVAGKRLSIGVTTTYTDGGDGLRTDRTATAIFQDISDHKRMEVLRLRAERLEGVAELSASLAHEIRNPLASIRSAVEQLSRSPFSGPDEQTLARLVMRESDRLSRLLSEFLDFARVRVTRTQPIDLAILARSAVRLAAASDNRNGVRIRCDADRDEYIVEGDEDLLHRAVFNLLLNAIQASPPGAEVEVEVGAALPEHLSGAQFEYGAATLSVSDSGHGIPVEIRDKLFDPFFTTKPGGSGLGLAVVHRAIEAHRGLVFLDSGQSGTRFTVVLPRAEPSRRPATTPSSSLAVLT
jgi:two-component system sensor histidine kinase PilS (NtrC family)